MTSIESVYSGILCPMCLKKARERNPNVLGCPWLSFDNDICDELKALVLQMEGGNNGKERTNP